MIKEIQKLTNQIVEFLKDKKGFSTSLSHHGVIITVQNPNETETVYDGYELLLYTLAVREIGSDIQLNINKDENGKELFAINTDANLNLESEIEKINAELHNVKHDTIDKVWIGKQTADSTFPYCVMTLYKNGNWMRHDLVMAELLFAVVKGMKLEVEDSAYVYKKLRELSSNVQNQIKELDNK